MSQVFSQIARQQLSQEQRLTPQLIQAMDILQLNAMALEDRIAQEIDANPALEALSTDVFQAPPEPDAPPDSEQALVAGDDHDFERLDAAATEAAASEYDVFEDDPGYRGTRSRERMAQEGDQKLEAMANQAARSASLQEHLLDQWTLMDLDDETQRLGAAIIETLDDTGRLPLPLAELQAQISPTPSIERLEDALAHVQQLDPAGVGFRDHQECLLLQLENLPGDTTLERRIVEEHFDDLQRNRLPQIARALGVEVADVKAALERIGRLSLRPGLEVIDRSTPAIVPDVVVEYLPDEDRYDVRLTRAHQRELRIAPEFRRMLERARDDKASRDFARQKIAAAAAIIDAVRFRNERLLDVARAVVEAQRDFLDRGEQHIKVLRMSDLAERFGCDPSTISRTVDEKWVETPRGIYPLRRFFTGGKESEDGEVLGWGSIKAKVQEIIAREDKRDPLSDDVIVERLKAEGIDLKRRTVAKYRAQLGIPNTRQRRQY